MCASKMFNTYFQKLKTFGIIKKSTNGIIIMCVKIKGGMRMSRRNRGVMSEDLKYELAKELGVADTVAKEGWGSVSSRNCGNLVRLAIERAEKAMAEEYARKNGGNLK